MTYFKKLGYGEKEDVIKKLRGPWTIIRDDDAASVGADSYWFAAPGLNYAEHIRDYEQDGGTVSESFSHYG